VRKSCTGDFFPANAPAHIAFEATRSPHTLALPGTIDRVARERPARERLTQTSCFDSKARLRIIVDLMISGHMHRAAIVPAEPGRHSYPIVLGGGSRITDRTIIRVNVNPSGLEAVIIDSDGNVVTTCNVTARKR
jgi:hypothetical protein